MKLKQIIIFSRSYKKTFKKTRFMKFSQLNKHHKSNVHFGVTYIIASSSAINLGFLTKKYANTLATLSMSYQVLSETDILCSRFKFAKCFCICSALHTKAMAASHCCSSVWFEVCEVQVGPPGSNYLLFITKLVSAKPVSHSEMLS